MSGRTKAFLLAALICSGCGANASPGSDDGGAGSGGSSGHLPDAAIPDAPPCSVMDFELHKGNPPDVLIVLDRSGQMSTGDQAGGPRWMQITQALDQVVMATQSGIRWGIEFFPGDQMCQIGSTADVPIADANYGAVSAAIASTSPTYVGEPMREGIHQGALRLQGLADGSPKYMLLATAGNPTCAAPTNPCVCPNGWTPAGDNCCMGSNCLRCESFVGPDLPATTQAVTDAASLGIPTFVLGVAIDSSAGPGLDQLALAGGVPRPSGSPSYYPGSNESELATALGAIANQLVSCHFPLTQAPASPDLVDLDVLGPSGSQMVPRDPMHRNGWDFGPGNLSIDLYGSWCQLLQTGQQTGTITAVHAIFNCPPVGIRQP